MAEHHHPLLVEEFPEDESHRHAKTTSRESDLWLLIAGSCAIVSILMLMLYAILNMTTGMTASHPGSTANSSDSTRGNSSLTPRFSQQELYGMTTTFLDAFMYPNNDKQARAINSTLFAPDIQGRVDATRTFDGRELNTEYIFALFADNPGSKIEGFFTLLGHPVSYNITKFLGHDNIVSVEVTNAFYVVPIAATVPVTIQLSMTFNEQREINQYDASIKLLPWYFQTLLELGAEKFRLTTPELQALVAERLAMSICTIAESACTGSNRQYDSPESCKDFLLQKVRFGLPHEMGMHTLLCRMVHQAMVPLRPEVHCPHVGPSGGAFCKDDLSYASVITEKYFTNSPFIPHGL